MSRRKKHNQIISHKVHASSAVPVLKTEERHMHFGAKDYFKFGSDNLFPQAVAALNRKSPIHRGVLNYKTIFTAGKGFQVDESDLRLNDVVNKINNKNQSLRQIAKNLILDKYSFGNAYMEIVTDSRGSFMSLFHIDATKVRIKRDMKSVVIHPDWRNENRYKNEDMMEIPLYPEFKEEDGVRRSVWHFKTYEPEFSIYGVPGWVSALDAAAIGYKTNKWNVSRLDNSFQTSGVLLIDGNMSPEDAVELQDEFSKEFTGEGNQGKVLMMIKQLGKSEGTQFIPLNQNNEGDWMNLHKQSSDDIITAHNWFRSLSGVADNTGFDTKRILNEYDIALSTVISEEQSMYIDAFKTVLNDILSIDPGSLKFINKAPVSIATLIDANRVVTIAEGRSALGLPSDETDMEQSQYINS